MLWLERGAFSEQAAGMERRAGAEVIRERSLKVEHARLLGRLHWLGCNSGVFSARLVHG